MGIEEILDIFTSLISREQLIDIVKKNDEKLGLKMISCEISDLKRTYLIKIENEEGIENLKYIQKMTERLGFKSGGMEFCVGQVLWYSYQPSSGIS